MQSPQANTSSHQSGNIFLIVLIGVVLFTALIFSMSRGFQEAPSNISAKEARMAVSAIASYARELEQGVSEMIQFNSCSQSQISFSVADTDAYHFVTTDECKIFNSAGGGVSKKETISGVNNIYYTSDNFVEGIGQDCVAGVTENCTEFAVIFDVDKIVCEAINSSLNLGSPVMQVAPNNISLELHDGIEVYDGTSGEITALPGKGSGCVGYDYNYYYYHVLMGR